MDDFLSVRRPTYLAKSYPFSSQILCTTCLHPKALALLPGFCIAVPLLSVLTNIAASRTCLIVAMNTQTLCHLYAKQLA
jgi:hypothetical protein